MKKKKICVVIGTAMNLNSLYKDQFKFLIENGYEITGIAPKGIEHEWLRRDGIKTKVIHLKRTPAPLEDLYSLLHLSWYFLFNRFDIVSVSTPKASLLGTLAAVLTFQKNIFYTLRGRAYETTSGFTRKFYEGIEKLVCSVAKKVFCISHELKDDVVSQGICTPDKIFVIGSGSSNGVDLNKFTLTEKVKEKGDAIREKFSLKPSDILIMYSGRIRKDKGINELVPAFSNLVKKHPNIYLLIQGKYEEFDPLEDSVLEEIKNNPKIIQAGWEKNIEHYFAASDIFAFPSHREGFGNVAIEASAMELPVLGFNVIGCRESILNGETGVLYKEISSASMERGLELLINDPELRKQLGTNGRKRIVKEFDSKIIWKELLHNFNHLVGLENNITSKKEEYEEVF